MDGLLEQLEKLTKENGRLTKLAKDCETLEHLKQARDKNIEIQKLLEGNIQTLENRCELLEMQNDQLRKDKQLLQE